MGSSKTAQALITKFNYEERGMAVWLIKPATDDRDGVDIVASRIGLSARAQVIYPDSDPLFELARRGRTDVIICDECQFLTPAQVDSLREIVDEKGIPVLCFGLRADFRGGAVGIIRHSLFDRLHISGNIRQLLLQLDGMLGNARQLRNQLVHRRIHGLKLRFDLILLFGGIGQLLLDCGTFRFRLIQLLF